MPSYQFEDMVRQIAIGELAQQARDNSTGAVMPQAFGPEDAAAFVDLQNFHYFLKYGCGVNATQVDLPNLIREFAASHGLNLVAMHFFTGIHDPERDPVKYGAMVKRIHWLRKNGAVVTALPVLYHGRGDTARVEEKGVDVRIASELLRSITKGLRRAVVISQDKDIAQAVLVGKEIAQDLKSELLAYSPRLTGAPEEQRVRTGVAGLEETTPLDMPVAMIRRHTRAAVNEQPSDALPS